MKKSRITNEARKAVYRRDGFQCACCGDNRRLQIHHITKRSQGGGDEQMNLVTLCSVCHALAHGINLAGVDLTPNDVKQTVVEYMADYYADLGLRWPDGEWLEDEPADFHEAIAEWLDSFAHPAKDDPDWTEALMERVKQGYGKGGTK